MKNLVLFLTLLFPTVLLSQIDCGAEDICIVEFNASFNKIHDVSWLYEIEDVTAVYVDILEQPELQKKYEVFAVPTIIILDGSREIERYTPNIMLEITATKEEVQEVVEEILFNRF